MKAPVAIVLSRFPLVTETFILREVIELERQGRPVVLVPLLRENPPVLHDEARPWMDRALWTPVLSPAILAACARALLRRPGRLLSAAGVLLRGAPRAPRSFLQGLGILPKSVWIAEALERRGVRHVHAHFATHPSTAALVIARLMGTSWSFTVHAHDLFVPWRRFLLEEKVREAAFVRCISRFNAETLERMFPGSAPGRMRVIHVGIEPERYSEARAEDAAGAPRILCIAALKPYKGIPVLVEACARLRDAGIPFACEHIGAGPQEEEVRDRVRRAGLGDAFALSGPLPQHEVARRIGRSAVFALPSVVAPDGQMEGIPVALMEAMASGVPVVTTRISGIPELVEDGVTGLLVPPGDPEALAGALKRLLADPDLRRRLGEAGREKVRREFALGSCTAALDHEVASILQEPVPPP